MANQSKLIFQSLICFLLNCIICQDNETNCNDIGAIKTINWNTMTQNQSELPSIDVKMNVDTSSLTLNIRAELEYVGMIYIN